MSSSRFRSLALIAATVAASGAAMAQSKTWTMNDTVAPGACTSTAAGTTVSGATNIGNGFSCTQQETPSTNSMVVTAWSGAAATNFAAAAVTPQGTNPGNGYGVGSVAETGGNASGQTGDHSVDNGGLGGIDALLLKFTTGAEALTHVTVGWTGSDGDFQIFRWIGANPSTDAASLTGKNASNLTTLVAGAGWQLVSTVGLAGGIDTPDMVVSGFNTGNLTSSYWLLSAYNSNVTNTAAGTNLGSVTTVAGYPDQLKFLGVGTSAPGKVPEPLSLALVATALVGMRFTRRKAA